MVRLPLSSPSIAVWICLAVHQHEALVKCKSPNLVLSEEFFVSQFLADPYVSVSFAEIQDLVQNRICSVFVFLHEPDFAGLNANFKFAVAFKKLIKPKLLSSVFLEDLPVLNQIYQAISP